MHIDYCHSYASSYTCTDCRAAYSTYDERDFEEDPYSAIWMSPEDQEHKCERCTALLKGATPLHESTYVPGRYG